jgi:alkylation response protein AidB-like acyl-CoA dehydrogenase
LCGTGSHDIALDDVFVPEEWTGSLFAAPTVHHPLDSLPLLGRLGVELGACAVGIAQGALDDVVEIGRTKRPLGGLLNRVAEDPVFQYKLGRLDMDLRTARLLVRDVARADEEVAARGTKRSDIELLERRTTLNKVAELAASVVDGAYTMCGTSGLYLGSPLQRRARDIHALTQHFILSANTYSPLGASLLGEPTNTGPF